ncbi:MAG TPA: hypothetical protein VHG08_09470 [Longimicrobium sp.]|nr:hypothetical protein [Longimicrobium sp.]
MDVEREITDRAELCDDDHEEHACARLSEAALGDWSRDEEDAAWAHLQKDGKSSEPTRGTAAPSGDYRGLSGDELLRFVGTISPEDLDLMERIIEEECERIDPEE